MRKPTVVLLVLDALGMTTLEYLLDHHEGNATGKIPLPNLTRLGLGTLLAPHYRRRIIVGSQMIHGTYAARLTQASATADSVIGHREMCGVIDHRIYRLFPNGFPAEYIRQLEALIGRRTMFNEMAGGVEAIEQNAEEHRRTSRPIVYASMCDPLIQIAMDESVIPVPEQHWIADTALSVAIQMGIQITRSIARAFIRTVDGEYVRTANRHDAVLALPGLTLVEVLRAQGVEVISVGKPSDLVNTTYDRQIHLSKRSDLNRSLGLRFVHPKEKDTNPYTIQGIVDAIAASQSSGPGTLVFGNAVDTDSLYGHTRDVEGALRSICEIDRVLPLIQQRLSAGDLLLITADHGMDHRPDYGYHNNEPVPLLARVMGSHTFCLDTNTSPGFTQVGDLVAQAFGCSTAFRDCIRHVRT